MADMTVDRLPDGRAAPEGTTMLAADGTPLRVSLQRSLRRQKRRAFLLVAPLLAFILVFFALPIADMLFRSVDNHIVPETLPRTVEALAEDPDPVPGEPVFVALYEDLVVAERALDHRLDRTDAHALGERLDEDLRARVLCGAAEAGDHELLGLDAVEQLVDAGGRRA